MKTREYRALRDKLNSEALQKRIPLSGMIEVTRRCPLACAHCYNNLPLQDEKTSQNELSYQEHCRILDQITDAGCLWIAYTGGEIFARKDFLDIYTYAKRKGLLVTLFTNGILLTREIADYLATLPPHSVEITIYGVTAKTHERVTGIAGSFEKCMNAVRLLMDRKIRLDLKTMALSLNEDEILPMKRFVEQELGLRFRFDPLVTPRLDYSRSPLALRLPAGRVVELDFDDPSRSSGWKRVVEGCAVTQEPLRQLYNCSAGLSNFGIDPYGGLNTCFFTPNAAYDLRRGSFREGWEGLLRQDRGRTVTKMTRCVECSIRGICGVCPSASLLETGDPEAPVDYFCEVAHLRANALGVRVKPHGECRFCNA